jgi:peptidoglycan/LPS O-acetylase OafA/YrhL
VVQSANSLKSVLAASDIPAPTVPPPIRTAVRGFRPDVEGLRAIAVLMVLINHTGSGLLPGGYVGVDVFFVLSGFLITGLLLQADERGSISLTAFYARRVRRILPASSLVLVATVIGSFYFLSGSRALHVADDAQWSSLFASNFNFIQQSTDYLNAQAPPSPLQHFWSLAVEEQFYAVWPLSILVLATVARRVPLRTKLAVLLAAVIASSLSWSVIQTAQNGAEAYFSPLTRAWELAAGALLAVGSRVLLRLPRGVGVALSLAGVAMIVASGLVFDDATPFPGYAVALPVLGTALAVAGGTCAPGGGAEVLLRLAPVQWLGKLSYSLYLWHWPVLAIAREHMATGLGLGRTLLLCLLSLALAAVTFWAVERPVRNSTWLKRRSPLLSIVLGVCLVGASLSLVAGLSVWLAPPATPVQPPPTVLFPQQ